MTAKINEMVVGAVGTATSGVGTALQTNEVLQTISLIITIIGGILTFIVMPLYKWYKEAKKDGKIDKDEIKEGVQILGEGVEKVQNSLDDKKKGDKK